MKNKTEWLNGLIIGVFAGIIFGLIGLLGGIYNLALINGTVKNLGSYFILSVFPFIIIGLIIGICFKKEVKSNKKEEEKFSKTKEDK